MSRIYVLLSVIVIALPCCCFSQLSIYAELRYDSHRKCYEIFPTFFNGTNEQVRLALTNCDICDEAITEKYTQYYIMSPTDKDIDESNYYMIEIPAGGHASIPPRRIVGIPHTSQILVTYVTLKWCKVPNTEYWSGRIESVVTVVEPLP